MTETNNRFNPEMSSEQMDMQWDMLEVLLKNIDFGNAELRKRIKEIIGRPESFLGKGGTALVFDLDDQCVKIMPNRHADRNAGSYDLGNTVSAECGIQNRLRDVEVDGVYAPRVLSFYDGAKITAIVMERLEAVNMQMVLNDKEKLPNSFLGDRKIKSQDDVDEVLEVFFVALQDYVLEMHERGVAHCDLMPRNIMIDKSTGKPRVIDFGRAKLISAGSGKKSEEDLKLMEKDLEELEKTREKMEVFLKTKLKQF